ncbi:MAG: response regulator [Dehalococcoidia bacterium]
MEEKTSVLLVDDNTSLCRTMSFVLERTGYAVTIAGDGAEAIESVEAKPFDMIFMDIKMPVMDGVETYKRIKQVRPEAMVMMMTGYAVEDLVREALQEGAFGVMYKPLDMEKVIAAIERAIGARNGALIMVVDDEPGTCITLKNILVRKGYEVGTAHTGEEAIAIARERTYDIIFIDMKLPTLNGLETYLAIKEVSPEAIAIMMTAYREETADIVQDALDSSAYTCLYKPLDMASVLEMIEGILKRQREEKGGRDGEAREHTDR